MGSGGDESVTVYGINPDSDYITLKENLKEKEVYVSSAFAKKFTLKTGDTVPLHAEYENKSYEFRVKGIVDYDGGIAVFMDRENYAHVFDKDADEFSGYFSKNEITDIDEEYIATVVTEKDITKVTTQLQHSMGGFMDIFKYALVVLAAALIYLLAKLIIEKNEQSISMAKILGFRQKEIASVYIIPTAMVVVLFSVISFWIGYYLMIWVFHVFMLQMDGYFAFYMKVSSMILSVLYLLIGYLFVSLIDFHRIKKIPLDVALKNIE
jgi:putative ABC transport system permease protein